MAQQALVAPEFDPVGALRIVNHNVAKGMVLAPSVRLGLRGCVQDVESVGERMPGRFVQRACGTRVGHHEPVILHADHLGDWRTQRMHRTEHACFPRSRGTVLGDKRPSVGQR